MCLQDKFDDIQKNIDEIENVHLQDKFDDLKKNIIDEIQKFQMQKIWEKLICCFIIKKKYKVK